jgi:hypothetical protein
MAHFVFPIIDYHYPGEKTKQVQAAVRMVLPDETRPVFRFDTFSSPMFKQQSATAANLLYKIPKPSFFQSRVVLYSHVRRFRRSKPPAVKMC